MTKKDREEELKESMTMVHTPDGINHNRERKKPTKNDLRGMDEEELTQLVVDELWNYMKKGKLNLEYATIGYCGERQVLDYDLMVDLLMNYGYRIGYVLSFLDVIEECSNETGLGPLIMRSKDSIRISCEVNDLPNSIMRKIEKLK